MECGKVDESRRSMAGATGLVFPSHAALYYDGAWHAPKQGRMTNIHSPASGEFLGQAPDATSEDAEAAIAAARAGFRVWRAVPPLGRARIMRQIAAVIREHAAELGLLDAADGGNPVSLTIADVHIAAEMFEFFAGLVTEMKGRRSRWVRRR